MSRIWNLLYGNGLFNCHAKENEYRQSQDYISEFISDRVIRDPNGRIKKMELNSEFTIWHGANYGGRSPGLL